MEVANIMEQYLAVSDTPLIGVETQQEFIDIIEETKTSGLSACFHKGAGMSWSCSFLFLCTYICAYVCMHVCIHVSV